MIVAEGYIPVQACKACFLEQGRRRRTLRASNSVSMKTPVLVWSKSFLLSPDLGNWEAAASLRFLGSVHLA